MATDKTLEEKKLPVSKSGMPGPTTTSHWVIKDLLCAGAYPGKLDDRPGHLALLRSLLDAGINIFISLQTEDEEEKFTPYREDLKKIAKEMSVKEITFIKFPIKDRGVAKDENLLIFVEQIIKLISSGSVIYLHCHGGHGRTGTVVSILLSKIYNLKPSEAIKLNDYYHSFRVNKGRARNTSLVKIQRAQVLRLMK